MSTPQGVDPVAAVIAGGFAEVSPFGAGSRYHGVELATIDVDGVPVRYVSRRLVPSPARFAAFAEHVVAEGERIDTIAATRLADPELFWRIADANNLLHPEEAVAQAGRRLRITLAEGIPTLTDVVT
jgi:hypothetical protein